MEQNIALFNEWYQKIAYRVIINLLEKDICFILYYCSHRHI